MEVNLGAKLNSVGIIGDSPAIKLLACQIETAASCDLTVLVTGESGTGKELVARALCKQSARAAMPFISINCGALTETLMESELFGYERGAFTGAGKRRKGLFEAANNGTIFLDEIAEMPIASQVKLLRVLQEGAVRPVGAHGEVQILSASLPLVTVISPRKSLPVDSAKIYSTESRCWRSTLHHCAIAYRTSRYLCAIFSIIPSAQ